MSFAPRVLALLAMAAVCTAFTGGSLPGYSCNPATCTGPCLCASQSAPGGLSGANIPQFVLLTHDDAVDDRANTAVRKVSDGFKNPNGCNVPVTWFVTETGSSCDLLTKLHADNHELACHTVHHPALVVGYPGLEAEMLGVRTWMNATCGLPLTDLLGFRAPYLVHNPPQRAVLEKNGMLYDSSIDEPVGPDSPTTPTFAQRLWPSSMDQGIGQQCNWTYPDGQCQAGEKYAGLWEVPMWDLPFATTDTETNAYTMDPGAGFGGDVYTTLATNFDQAYGGNRAPFPLYIHAPWISDSSNSAAAIKFIQYALSKPDVYFVTMQQLVRWMQNPVPASQVGATLTCKPVNLTPPVAVPCQIYTVKAGDYIDAIVGTLGLTDSVALLALNPSVTANNLQPGMKLKVPPFPSSCGAGVPFGASPAPGAVPPPAGAAGSPPAAPSSPVTAPAAPPPAEQCRTWTVQADQTLTKIAALTNSTVSGIAAATKLTSLDTLSIGQVLNIPPYPACCATKTCAPPQPPPAAPPPSLPPPATPTTTPASPAVATPASGLAPSRAEFAFYLAGMSTTAFNAGGSAAFIAALAQVLAVPASSITAAAVPVRRRALRQAQALGVNAVVATDDPLGVYYRSQNELSSGDMAAKLQSAGLTLQGPPVVALYKGGVALALPPPTAAPPAAPPTSDKSHLTTAAIVWVAVGGAAVLVAVAVVTVLLCRRRRRNQALQMTHNPMAYPAALADINVAAGGYKHSLDADRAEATSDISVPGQRSVGDSAHNLASR